MWEQRDCLITRGRLGARSLLSFASDHLGISVLGMPLTSSHRRSCLAHQQPVSQVLLPGLSPSKDVMKEYMGDVCKQNAMTGWHKVLIPQYKVCAPAEGIRSKSLHSSVAFLNDAQFCKEEFSCCLQNSYHEHRSSISKLVVEVEKAPVVGPRV